MSSLTNREYRQIAKRPGKRGFGFADRRDRPVVETSTAELIREAQEDLNELAEGMAECGVCAGPDCLAPHETLDVEPAGSDVKIEGDYGGHPADSEEVEGPEHDPSLEEGADESRAADEAPVGKTFERPNALGSVDG